MPEANRAAAMGGEPAGAGPSSAFADWLAIHDLLLRYARALDSRDWPLLQTCFTTNAHARYGESEVVGPDAIADFCTRALAPFRATQHFLAAPDIVIEGDRATARTCLQATHARSEASGESLLIVGGTYHDEIVREDGQWRLAVRCLETAWRERRPAAG